MNQSYLFYYIGAALVFILIIAIIYMVWRLQSQNRTKGQEYKDYIKALNYLIDGNLERAVEYFYNSIRIDTENIDAYIKIGDIFRQQNKIEKAIKIHKELLVRQNLNHVTKTEIIRSLVLDFYAAQFYDKALENLNFIFSVEPKNRWAKKQQLIIFEAKKDWENAFRTLKVLAKWENRVEINDQLSLYKVEAAKQKFEINEEKNGRFLLREAIKVDDNCSSAYLELGDSYVREDRLKDAITVWVDFIRKIPSQSYLVFDRLQEVLYTSGSYGEIENILKELNQEFPDNLDIIFTLADIRIRKGDIDSAVDLCKTALEKESNSVLAKMKLIKLYERKEQKEEALKLAVDVADQSIETTSEFMCTICNYKSIEPLWYCPKCRSWKSFNI